MATTDHTVKFDKKILHHISPYLPTTYTFCDEMIEDGMYQRDRLVELAMARNSNGLYEMDSQDNWDFTDFSDAKSTTVNYRVSQGPKGRIVVRGIKNKHTLRVITYDPQRDTVRYFVFWEWYRNGNQVVEFSADPTFKRSKFTNGEWGVELNSFEELAQYKFSKKYISCK